ncbi:MAG: hypothetical protein CVV53_00460 [Spirochaetae bacterium HGW-Spirochaetae-9]|nr:MAG: hypothetical protein CVV53_00460 [Spirochaetae bacterium HGW-Spirochaetae-9]
MKKSKFIAYCSIIFLVLAATFLLLAGCSLDYDPEGRVTLHDEELTLVDLDDSGSYSRTIPVWSASRAAKAAKPAPGGATITYVAEVEPPADSLDRKLQASHIALTSNGKYAIVVYMLTGAGSSGAVDIFNVSNPARPVLLKNTLIPNFDIAAVIEDSGRLYLAGQRIGNPDIGKNAFVMAVDYNTSNGSLMEATAASIALPGHFATDLVWYNGRLYVTTGAYSSTQPGVGLFALKLNNGTFTIEDSSVASYPDLRSVAAGGEDLAVFEAQAEAPFPASIARLDIYKGSELGSPSKTVNLTSFPAQAEAKSKVGYFGGLFFVAANMSGVAIVDPDDGTVRASIPAPRLTGLAPELQTSNAVSSGNASGKDILLIANGEAGLWVGDGDLVRDQRGGTISSTSSISGSIRFGAGESVNYVAGKSSLVVAAVGTGGLKVLNLTVK